MKRRYIDYEHRLMDGLTTARQKCKCGHTQLLPRIKGKEYILCCWCNSRMYYDKDKQKVYDEKCERDEFKYNISKIIYKNSTKRKRSRKKVESR